MKKFILCMALMGGIHTFAAEEAAKELHTDSSYHATRTKREVSSTHSGYESLEKKWKAKEGAICYDQSGTHQDLSKGSTCLKI